MKVLDAVRIAAGVLMVGTCAAAAQEQPAPTGLAGKSLEDLLAVEVDTVEGAARHVQRTTEAPASVTVLTASDIEMFGWRTLADALKSVRGFHMTYDRNYSYIGVRAFGRPTDYNNRLLVLIDGHRLNDSIYDGALMGTEFPIDLSLIERIEVIRGPGSALYGTSAFLAVVSVVTKKGAQVGAPQLSVTGASLGTYRVEASQGWSSKDGKDGLLSVSRYDSQGQQRLYFPEFADTAGGIVERLDGDRSTKLFGSARLGRVSVQGLYSTREKHVPTASWDTTFGDPRYVTSDNRGWASLGVTGVSQGFTLRARAYVDHYRYVGDFPAATLSSDGAASNAFGGELVARRVFGRHAVTMGLEPRFNVRQDQWNGDDAAMLLDDRRSSGELAFYAQDEIALGRRLSAVLGGRVDWWSLRGGTGRPRLGLVYRTETDTALKVLYGEAYRAPNLYELYYFDDATTRTSDLALHPEVVRTVEVVAERRVGRRVRVAASVYDTRIAGLIDPLVSDDGTVQYANLEPARSTGVELEGEGRWPSGLMVRGSLAVQRARSDQQRPLSNAPGQLGTAQVAMPFLRRQVVLGADTTFTSWRTAVGGERLPAYWLTSVTATYKPLRVPIVLGASLYNLFDADYSHPVGVEFRQAALRQDGRTAALRATLRF